MDRKTVFTCGLVHVQNPFPTRLHGLPGSTCSHVPYFLTHLLHYLANKETWNGISPEAWLSQQPRAELSSLISLQDLGSMSREPTAWKKSVSDWLKCGIA